MRLDFGLPTSDFGLFTLDSRLQTPDFLTSGCHAKRSRRVSARVFDYAQTDRINVMRLDFGLPTPDFGLFTLDSQLQTPDFGLSNLRLSP